MWAVFEKAFYDARKTMLWLCVGLSIFAVMVAAIFPTIAEQGEEFSEVYESMPEPILALVGGELDFTDPVAWVNIEFFLWTVLILGAVVMVQAFNAVTNAERNGTMDVMLAFPISRRDLLIGRYLNTLATLVVVLTAVFLTLLASTYIWTELDIAAGDLAVMIYGSLIILVPYATFTYALTTLIPSSKRWAGAIAYMLFFGMYFIHGVAGTTESLSQIRPFLLFDYYSGTRIVQDGVDVGNILLMAVITLLFAALAWWRIDEKQLGI